MISILVPTCHRLKLLKNMLSSLKENTHGYDLNIVLVVDEDADSYNYIVEDLMENDEWFDERIDPYFNLEKMGALRAWNDALKLCTSNIIVPAGDDHIFHEGWLDFALESHEKQLNGYGVVGMNDLAYDGNTQLATMFLFDRKYCKEVMGGIFAPPMYHYYCIDSEWNAKAKMLGHFYWDERSIQEHIHSSHGKRPVDDLDREKMDAGWMEIDNKTFTDRQARGFPIEWEPLI
jgi:glycosyltransferase involved in cell wall biosynthesis